MIPVTHTRCKLDHRGIGATKPGRLCHLLLRRIIHLQSVADRHESLLFAFARDRTPTSPVSSLHLTVSMTPVMLTELA